MRYCKHPTTLLTWKNILIAVGIGVVSWGGECVGAVSALPGGLGAADTSITGLLLLLVTPLRDLAVAATLLIRFCTLWFGVSLGLITLLALYRRLLFSPAITPGGAS
ncbi:MAG TPA: hypothetical protein VI793_10875 [Anaerolineales bacterium]|nr:hypothetical protein [Anaerolineales bacterium]